MKKKFIIGFIVFLFALFARGIVLSANAASLTYANATNVALSSPATTLTIATGSVADAFTVNATSVAVTISNLTGGEFTLISPVYDLSVSASAGGGSAIVSCSNGIHTVVVSQNSGLAVYTITPAGIVCSNPATSTPVVVSTGGGGSAYDLSINHGATMTSTSSVMLSLYGTEAYMMELSNNSNFTGTTWVPYATTYPWVLASTTGEQTVFVQFRTISGTIVGSAEASINFVPAPASSPASPISSQPILGSSTVGMTTSQMQALLISLESELQALESAAGNQASSTTSTPASPSSFFFSHNLSYGMSNIDVHALQQFLVSQHAGPNAEKLKLHGLTQYFGPLTRAALIEFQRFAHIVPASGYFGPITRAYVNKK